MLKQGRKIEMKVTKLKQVGQPTHLLIADSCRRYQHES
jgi:hypothetical protein